CLVLGLALTAARRPGFGFVEEVPMNEHVEGSRVDPAGEAQPEWQARIDLAAVYRLIHRDAWGVPIYNHCLILVPGQPSRILMNRHVDMWDEVRATNLVKVDIYDDLDERSGVNRPGFTLHGGLMAGRPDINCAVHIHGETGMAISALKHGLRRLCRASSRFYRT